MATKFPHKYIAWKRRGGVASSNDSFRGY